MRDDIKTKIKDSKDGQVNLDGMNILDTEVEEIALQIKKRIPHVQTIILSNNLISDDGAIILGNLFRSLSELTVVDLQFNKIDKIGATALFTLKKLHPTMMILMHGNKIINVEDMLKIESSPHNGSTIRSPAK